MAEDASDVIEMLTQEHEELRAGLGAIERISGPRERKEMASALAVAIRRHLVTEELHIYPAVEKWVPGLAATLEHDRDEHELIVQMVQELEGLEADDPTFEERLDDLRDLVRHHSTSEEQHQFPQLRAHVPGEVLLELASKVGCPDPAAFRARQVPRPQDFETSPAGPSLRERTTEEILDDHLRCRIADDVEADIRRNYAADVIIFTSKGAYAGHQAVRELHEKLRAHVPSNYEIVLKLTSGPYAFIEWRAREAGRSVEDGADSFVVRNGRIVFQSIHYSVQETMPL